MLWKAFVMFVAIPLLLIMLHVILSAIFGWVIGLFFGKAILGILSQIGISGYSMWQIGAFMGFVASFFSKYITYDVKRTWSK